MMWLYAFALTCTIELPIVMLCADSGRRRRAAVDSFGANLVTHPTAWYLARSLMVPWLGVEVAVTLAEGAYRTEVGKRGVLEEAEAPTRQKFTVAPPPASAPAPAPPPATAAAPATTAATTTSMAAAAAVTMTTASMATTTTMTR